MGARASRQQELDALDDKLHQQFDTQRKLLAEHDQTTKLPHLLIELRSLGFVEVCGKDIGGIFERLRKFFQSPPWDGQNVTHVLKPVATGCCMVEDGRALQEMKPWDQVCDMNFMTGQLKGDGTVIPNGVYKSRGFEGENNMGKLTMKIIDFMTNTCGWGLHLVDGGNLGRYGQFREQQIKFKAPHPLNLMAPHLMIELRQVGYIEVNGPDTGGIYDSLKQWFSATWGAQQVQADPDYCDVKFKCSCFRRRGTDAENNMGQRTMEIVDFMTQKMNWTLLTCNGGNYGCKGDKREQQLVFRKDAHVQHGLNHIMVELRDRGYIEINGLHDSPEIGQKLAEFYQSQGCIEYKPGFLESSEKFSDIKYTCPETWYYRDRTTNNLGKRTIELAKFLGEQGWLLTLCNGGNVSDYSGFIIKREQQIKFTKARPGDNAAAPLIMIEMRTIPSSITGDFEGVIEVNGLDTHGVHAGLTYYILTTMVGRKRGQTPYCDLLYEVDCFRCRDYTSSVRGTRWNGKNLGESNFGRYTMRLCDFMVDHIGEWDLIVCSGNSVDLYFENGNSVLGREQQLVFRYRPGGRKVFMAQMGKAEKLQRPVKQAPPYWKQESKHGQSAHEIVPVSQDELKWIQQLLDGTFKKKATRDRDKGSPLPERYEAVSALRSEHPALWEKYANRRVKVNDRCKAREGDKARDFVEPKTKNAAPKLYERCEDPEVGNPYNEHYLFHGSNPTSAMSILDTSFTVDIAGKSAGTMFGSGIYLAEASSKADEYARDDYTGGAYDGLFAVLICRACLGRSFRTEKPGDFKNKCLKGNFDSVLGDREKAVGTYREFIFFDEGSVYPEYAVFYKRVYASEVAPPAPVAPLPMVMGAPGSVADPTLVDPPALVSAPIPIVMGAPGSVADSTSDMPEVYVPEGTAPGGTSILHAPVIEEVTI